MGGAEPNHTTPGRRARGGGASRLQAPRRRPRAARGREARTSGRRARSGAPAACVPAMGAGMDPAPDRGARRARARVCGPRASVLAAPRAPAARGPAPSAHPACLPPAPFPMAHSASNLPVIRNAAPPHTPPEGSTLKGRAVEGQATLRPRAAAGRRPPGVRPEPRSCGGVEPHCTPRAAAPAPRRPRPAAARALRPGPPQIRPRLPAGPRLTFIYKPHRLRRCSLRAPLLPALRIGLRRPAAGNKASARPNHSLA